MDKQTGKDPESISPGGTVGLESGSGLFAFLKRIFVSRSENTSTQFFRCTVAGGFATIIDVSIFSIGVNVFGLNAILSNTVSFIFGLIANYQLSRKWVFSRTAHNLKRDFTLFSIIGVIGLVMSNVLLFVFIDLRLLYHLLASSNDTMVKPAAKLAATAIVLFWNFIARKKIVFST